MPSKYIDKLFFDEFKIHVATTPAQRDEVYRIRYKVYCEELQYEPAEAFPNRMETDKYDRQSVHIFIQHRESGCNIGCIRLIFPVDELKVLPFQKAYNSELLDQAFDLENMPHNSICEVSRLAVISDFRKGAVKLQNFPDNITNVFEAQKRGHKGFPVVPLSLYLAGCAVLEEAKIDNIFTMMEPRLSRHLSKVGFQFHQVGHLVNYHGKRAPFYISLRELMRDLDPSYWLLRDKIFEEIRLDLKASALTLFRQKVAS